MDVSATGLGLVFKRNGRAPRVCFKCGTDRFVEPRTIDFVDNGQADAIERVPLCGDCHRAHLAARPKRGGRPYFIAGGLLLTTGRILSLTGLDFVVRLVVDLVGLALIGAGLVVRFLIPPKDGASPARLNVATSSDTDVVFEAKPEVVTAVLEAAKKA